MSVSGHCGCCGRKLITVGDVSLCPSCDLGYTRSYSGYWSSYDEAAVCVELDAYCPKEE